MHPVQAARKPKGLVFHFTYRLFPEGEIIGHEIECDLTAPTTLVVAMDNGYHVSIIVGADDKREWIVREIINLKFGYIP